MVLRQRGAGLVRKTGESVRWNKRKKKAKRVHRTRHEFGVAPVGISRFTCVFHLSSWGVALASSTYDPPSNGRASNDVTGFPRFPLVPSYRRGTTDVACILLFYLLPIVRPRMHMHCLSFPFALLSLSLSFFSFFFFFFFRTLTRYHAALRRSVATFPRVEVSLLLPNLQTKIRFLPTILFLSIFRVFRIHIGSSSSFFFFSFVFGCLEP